MKNVEKYLNPCIGTYLAVFGIVRHQNAQLSRGFMFVPIFFQTKAKPLKTN